MVIEGQEASRGGDRACEGMVENDKIINTSELVDRGELEAVQRPRMPLDLTLRMHFPETRQGGEQGIYRPPVIPRDPDEFDFRQAALQSSPEQRYRTYHEDYRNRDPCRPRKRYGPDPHLLGARQLRRAHSYRCRTDGDRRVGRQSLDGKDGDHGSRHPHDGSLYS